MDEYVYCQTVQCRITIPNNSPQLSSLDTVSNTFLIDRQRKWKNSYSRSYDFIHENIVGPKFVSPSENDTKKNIGKINAY